MNRVIVAVLAIAVIGGAIYWARGGWGTDNKPTPASNTVAEAQGMLVNLKVPNMT